MAYRTVSHQEAKTPEDAKAFIVAETGGVCVPTGVVKEVPGGFAVEVFSTDGFNSNAIIGAASIALNRGQLSSAQIDEQIRMFGEHQ